MSPMEAIKNGDVAKSAWFVILTTLCQGGAIAGVIGVSVWAGNLQTEVQGKVNVETFARTDARLDHLAVDVAKHSAQDGHQRTEALRVEFRGLMRDAAEKIDKVERMLELIMQHRSKAGDD